jgi:hypothetical protein
MTGFMRRGSEVFHTVENICHGGRTRIRRVSSAVLRDAVLLPMPAVTGFPPFDWR